MIGHPPEELTWSPDAKHLTYLDDGELMDLQPGTDSGAGKPHVLVSRDKLASLTGESDNETDRDHRERYKMASYIWAPDSAHLLFDSNGRLWLYDLASGKGVEIGVSGMGSGDDPQFSPNGEYVSFLRDHGLAVARLKEARHACDCGGSRAQLGHCSTARWIGYTRKSWTFAATTSGRRIRPGLAYLQMDETAVPEYPITDWIPTHATVDMQRYPQPGDAESKGPRGGGQRRRRRDGLGGAADSRRAGLHSALRMGGREDACGLRR